MLALKTVANSYIKTNTISTCKNMTFPFSGWFNFSRRGLSTAQDDELKSMIQDTIKNNDVVIYSKTYCPYCTSVKSLFMNHFSAVKTHLVELDTLPNGSSIQAALQSLTGQRTVPNVFVKGKHIGGNDDSQHAFKSGTLSEMLK
jgi:glutaredoxin 3